jgi:hypothetical protein
MASGGHGFYVRFGQALIGFKLASRLRAFVNMKMPFSFGLDVAESRFWS